MQDGGRRRDCTCGLARVKGIHERELLCHARSDALDPKLLSLLDRQHPTRDHRLEFSKSRSNAERHSIGLTHRRGHW
jgi:hypothetical protein